MDAAVNCTRKTNMIKKRKYAVRCDGWKDDLKKSFEEFLKML